MNTLTFSLWPLCSAWLKWQCQCQWTSRMSYNLQTILPRTSKLLFLATKYASSPNDQLLKFGGLVTDLEKPEHPVTKWTGPFTFEWGLSWNSLWSPETKARATSRPYTASDCMTRCSQPFNLFYSVNRQKLTWITSRNLTTADYFHLCLDLDVMCDLFDIAWKGGNL